MEQQGQQQIRGQLDDAAQDQGVDLPLAWPAEYEYLASSGLGPPQTVTKIISILFLTATLQDNNTLTKLHYNTVIF